jgi:tetratricopeptide (TPR) repeat protein
MEEGVILAGLNEPDQARPLLERALAIMSKNTQVSAGLSQANASLADLDTSSGHADTARRRLEAYLAAAGYARERTKPILQPVLVSAARAALAQGDAAAAQRYADDALAIASKNARGPDSSADVGETLLLMARIRLAARDPVAARSLLARAARCLTNGLGSDAPLAVEARRMMESAGADS